MSIFESHVWKEHIAQNREKRTWIGVQPTNVIVEAHMAIMDAYWRGIDWDGHTMLDITDYDDFLCDELDARGVSYTGNRKNEGPGGVRV